MTEAILIAVIIALLIYIGWDRYLSKQERGKLVNTIVARNAAELANLELAEKTKVEVPKINEYDSLRDMSELSDEEHSEAIKQEWNQTTES